MAEYHERLREIDNAEKMHRRSLEVREKLVSDFGEQPETRRDLGSGRYELGQLLYRHRQPEKAEKEFQLALEHQQSLAAEKPEVAVFAVELTRTLGMLGNCALDAGRLNAAADYFQRAQSLQEDVARRFPSELQLRAELGLTYTLLAAVRLKQELPQEALQVAESAVEHLESLRQAHPQYGPARSYLLNAQYQRASALVALDRPRQAVEALRAAIGAGMRSAARLREDARFESLHERTDFQQLLGELTAPQAE